MSVDFGFTKNNIDFYLEKLAAEYRKLAGRHSSRAEIILVGGSSVIINYGFRESTTDIDAYYISSYAMQDSILAVQEKLKLADKWFNSDFTKTNSFSPKIRQYSKFYKSFGGILDVRTINAEYLIAMKLVAARRYKHDCSDIIGILKEQKKMGATISYNQIYRAVVELYGNWNRVSDYAKDILVSAIKTENLEELYINICSDEQKSRNIVLNAQRNDQITGGVDIDELINYAIYKDILNNDNEKEDIYDEELER